MSSTRVAEPAAHPARADDTTRTARWIAWTTLLVMLLGLGLRTAQYVGHVDMWHDDLAIARNIEDRGIAQLVLQPLEYQQVAPVGFLAALDLSSVVIGVNEVGLRFVPWLFALAAMLLFWRVARRFVDGYPLLTALTLFAVSPALIWYGSSVKPYGADVAISLLLVWFALRYLEQPDDLRRCAVAGLVGGGALLFSFPAVPTAAVLVVTLLSIWWRRDPRPSIRPLALLASGWALGACAAGIAAMSLVDPATDSFMREFWADDFPPSRPLAALAWISARYYNVFAHSLIFVPPADPVTSFIVGLPIALAIAGLFVAWRRRQPRSLLLLAPIAAALGAEVVRLLPFDNRLGLHSAWPVLVLAAIALAGLERATRNRARLLPRILAGLAAVPLALIVLIASRPPLSSDGVRPRVVLEQLAQRLRPDDVIYTFTQGRHDIAFHGRRAGIDEWVQGERHNDDPRAYLREIDGLRGQPRLWFFWVRLDGDDPDLIRDYLRTIGREVEVMDAGVGDNAGAILYDLSDPARLANATAETFEHASLVVDN